MPNVMAAKPNIGGALYESSVVPFLVPRRKVSLTPTARVLCSNTANIAERRTWTQSEVCTWQSHKSEINSPQRYHVHFSAGAITSQNRHLI